MDAWYFNLNDGRGFYGPYSSEDINNFIIRRIINKDTIVYNKAFSDQAVSITDVQFFFELLSSQEKEDLRQKEKKNKKGKCFSTSTILLCIFAALVIAASIWASAAPVKKSSHRPVPLERASDSSDSSFYDNEDNDDNNSSSSSTSSLENPDSLKDSSSESAPSSEAKNTSDKKNHLNNKDASNKSENIRKEVDQKEHTYLPEAVQYGDYDIRNYMSPKYQSYILDESGKQIQISISNHTLIVPQGCEIYTEDDAKGNTMIVGNGYNTRTLTGDNLQAFAVYVPGNIYLIETPLIARLSDGSYSFTDFTNHNASISFNTTPEQLSADDAAFFKQQADIICANASGNEAKVKAVHDYVCSNFSYDIDVMNNRNLYNFDDKSVFNQKRGICGNFSRVTADLLNAEGIPCLMVMGIGIDPDCTYQTPMNHAWNMVYLNGRWYPLDTTWDCQNEYQGGQITASPMRDKYFLNEENVNRDHILVQEH